MINQTQPAVFQDFANDNCFVINNKLPWSLDYLIINEKLSNPNFV